MFVDKPLPVILVKRAVVFLFVICAVSFFYWVVGSESSFLYETQSMLLSIMRLSSLGIVVASGFGVFLALAMAIVRRYRFKVLSLVGYVLASVLGLAALALANLFLSSPLAPLT